MIRPTIRIGVVTDSHMGRYDFQITEALKDERLDLVSYLGDVPADINGHPNRHLNDIARTLFVYDRIGVPTLWIPGNYEDMEAYCVAFYNMEDELENIIDMSETRKYAFRKNGINVDLIFIPGARDFSRGFIVDDRMETGRYRAEHGQIYVFNPNDMGEFVTSPERTIVFAHSPIKMDRGETFDMAMRADYEGKETAGPYAHQLVREGKAMPKFVHVGNEKVGEIIDRLGVKIYVSGDIHEAAYTTDRSGEPVGGGIFSPEMFSNPGAAVDGKYGVLVYRDDGLAYMESRSVR
jgi:Icc-related predicted phosphoesterase